MSKKRDLFSNFGKLCLAVIAVLLFAVSTNAQAMFASVAEGTSDGNTTTAGPSPSGIIYFNMRGSDNNFYSTNECDFVGNSTLLSTSATASPTFAMDADATGTKIYAIEWTGGAGGIDPPIWEVDVATGTVNTAFGTLSGPPLDTNISGLSYNAADGSWYLVALEATGPTLYKGDITTGVFTKVHPTNLLGAGAQIDISIDASGNCYAHNLSDDMLYSVNLVDGTATIIGPTNQPANFAQGMDFCPDTGVLYATVYTGGGTGQFGSFNLATGNLDVIQETTPLNAEMEMVCLGSSNCGPNCPTGFTLVNGVQSSGDFADSCDADDVWWGLQSTTFAASFTPPAIEVQVDGTVPIDGGNTLTFCFEGHPTLAGGSAFITVALFNYTTGLYEQTVFATQPDGPPDALYCHSRDNTNGDYVDANGNVKARITCAKTTAGPVRLFIDSMYWEQN